MYRRIARALTLALLVPLYGFALSITFVEAEGDIRFRPNNATVLARVEQGSRIPDEGTLFMKKGAACMLAYGENAYALTADKDREIDVRTLVRPPLPAVVERYPNLPQTAFSFASIIAMVVFLPLYALLYVGNRRHILIGLLHFLIAEASSFFVAFVALLTFTNGLFLSRVIFGAYEKQRLGILFVLANGMFFLLSCILVSRRKEPAEEQPLSRRRITKIILAQTLPAPEKPVVPLKKIAPLGKRPPVKKAAQPNPRPASKKQTRTASASAKKTAVKKTPAKKAAKKAAVKKTPPNAQTKTKKTPPAQ